MSTTAPPVTESRSAADRATPAERELRLVLVADWLLEGRPRAEIQQQLMTVYQLSRRMAQKDVFEAQQRLATEAAAEEQLFYLRLSQHQRDKLLATVMNFTQCVANVDPKVIGNVTKLVAAATKLLDTRNATAEQIRKLNAGPHAAQPEVAAAIREMQEHLQRSNEAFEREVAPTPKSARKAAQEEFERLRARAAARAAQNPETDEQLMRRGIIPTKLMRASLAEGPDGPANRLCREILQRNNPPCPASRSPSRPARPRDELERQFLTGQGAQVLPAIVPPDPKSRPGKENELAAGVIDHSP